MTLGDLIKASPGLLDYAVSSYNDNVYIDPPTMKGIQRVSETISIVMARITEKSA